MRLEANEVVLAKLTSSSVSMGGRSHKTVTWLTNCSTASKFMYIDVSEM